MKQVHYRLLVLYALVLTFAGSAAALQLLRWRQSLSAEEAHAGPTAQAARGAGAAVLLLFEKVLAWLAGVRACCAEGIPA